MPSRALPIGFYLLLLCGLAAANVSVYTAVFAPRMLEINVLAVGKGSATLVRTPGGGNVLIDAGPDASILRALGETLPMWQRKIDAVILTGTKASLVGGLPEVKRRYAVSTRRYFGNRDTPYGTPILFDGVGIEIIAPGTAIISYGARALAISSTTPKGVYISDGETTAYAK